MTQGSSPDELKITREGEFMRFEFRGEFTVESAKQVVDAMVDASTLHKCPRALLDCRPMSGKMEIVDRFDVVSYAVKTRDVLQRTAIVGRLDQVLPDKFVETVAANRGFTIRVFTDVAEAERWLRS